jgi:hypothetical protein
MRLPSVTTMKRTSFFRPVAEDLAHLAASADRQIHAARLTEDMEGRYERPVPPFA